MGGANGKLGPSTSAIIRITDGYSQHYQNGSIYWTPTTFGEIHGEIWRKFNSLGAAVVGYPYGDVLAGPSGGEYSNFKNASVFGSIYWKQGIGAFFVRFGIRDKYLGIGGPSAVGYPTTDETSAKNDADLRYNHFERGTITWRASLGAHEVHGDIWLKYISLGGPDGFLAAARTDETILPDRESGRYSDFDGGSIYWSLRTGAHEVHGPIRDKWVNMASVLSWLGYPLTDETTVINFVDYSGNASGRYNRFQDGYIYYYPGRFEAVAVHHMDEVFEAAQKNDGLHRTVGTRYLLTILINPHVSPHDIDSNNPDKTEVKLPDPLDVESALFGTRGGVPVNGQKSSVRDFYIENSHSVFLANAGILSYNSTKQGGHYWNDSLHRPGCYTNDGWLDGHAERVADALKLAEKDFDFKKYDASFNGNRDGRLTPDELAILIVTPGDQYGVGSNSGAVIGGYETFPGCSGAFGPSFDLKLDGVTLTQRVEWYTTAVTPGNPIKLGLPAHELAHLLTGIPDLYFYDDKKHEPKWKFDAGIFSRMSATCSACQITHFDPFLKLKAGWLSYNIALGDGTYTLPNVETSGEGLIVYDPSRGRDEYFLLEYRLPGTSYDSGRGNAGGGLPNAGLAVWHIIEDAGLQKKMKPPGYADNWYRKGVLLVRANNGTPVDDSQALFTTAYTPLALTWSDGSSAALVVPLDSTADAGVRPPSAVRLQITR